MLFHELETNKEANIIALIMEVEEKTTKNGSSFLKLYLSDGETKIPAILWDHTAEQFKTKSNGERLLSFTIRKKIYKETPNYEISGYEPAPNEDMRRYIIMSPIDPDVLFEKIYSFSSHLHSPYKELVQDIFSKYHDKMLNLAAGQHVHHNYIGGFLYHTYRMVQSCLKIADIYPIINKELLVTGAILHDIGKLEELITDEIGNTVYSTMGNLLGHSAQGLLIIQEAAIRLELMDREEVKLLLHMIASHHGVMDYGAIRIPSIPEALLLNHFDMIDSRMDIFERTLKEMQAGDTSDKIFGLDCRVYKPNL